MKHCRYVLSGLALGFAVGYVISLLVPVRSIGQAFLGLTEGKKGDAYQEPPVQQDDPYIEELTRELNTGEIIIPTD